jgi:hypothetical protein
LAIWDEILPKWKPEGDEKGTLTIAYVGRKAAITAEHLESWKRASEFFLRAAKVAKDANDVLETGLIADSAYALWKAGDNSSAVSQLRTVLKRLEPLDNAKEDLRTFKLRKTVGQTLLHILDQMEGGKMQAASYPLFPGFCSDPAVSEKIRELPASDSKLLWVLLALIEAHARLKPLVFKQVCNQLRSSKDIPVKFFLVQLQLARAMYDGCFREVPAVAEEFARVYRIARTQVGPTPEPRATLQEANFDVPATTEDFQFGAHGLYAALLLDFCRGELKASKLRKWRESSAGLAIEQQVKSWIDDAQCLFVMSRHDAMKVLDNSSETFWRRSLAAINIAAAQSISPEELLYGHVMIVSALADNVMQRFLGLDLGLKFAEQWLEKVKFSGSLKTPRLTIPAIKNACAEFAPGMQKPCRILLAVEPAVSLRIPQPLREKLIDLAGTKEH